MDMISNLRKMSVIIMVVMAGVSIAGCEDSIFDTLLMSKPTKEEIEESRAREKKKIEQEKKWAKEDAEELAKEKNKPNQKQATEASKKDADKKGEDLLMEDPDEPPKGPEIKMFANGNSAPAKNGGSPPRFTIDKKYYVTKLGTYHWNGGPGAGPGTIGIKAADGKMYGPWKAELDQRSIWNTQPNIYIPAGSYTVVDSDPSTWSQNTESGGAGITWVLGIPVGK